MKLPKASLLIFITVVTLALIPGEMASARSLQPEARGLFGTISRVTGDHPRAVAGETDITLETSSGPVELTATLVTVVRVPGLESASVEDLGPGDPVAVLASGGRAVSILVQSSLPSRTRHFTGVVASVNDDGVITLQSRRGNQLSAPTLEEPANLQQGELVTAVLEQDLTTGSLVITGIDRAVDSLDRIEKAIELAGAQGLGAIPSVKALQMRLISNSTRHLTILQEESQRFSPPLGTLVWDRLQLMRGSYLQALSRARAGKPKSEVRGIVSSIDRLRQQLIVQPSGLDEVQVSITSDTRYWRVPARLPGGVAENWLRGGNSTQPFVREFGGRETRFEQLDIANRVRIWYELDSSAPNRLLASRVLVLPGENLAIEAADALLSLAQLGEATGVVTAVDSNSPLPTVNIQDVVTGDSITLTVAPQSRLRDGDHNVGIDSMLGATVAVSFDLRSFSVIELNRFSLGGLEATVSGVVHGFISKVAPGNFSIVTREGQPQAFNHTSETIIRRDGRKVTIGQVRLGDLVRPNSRFRAGGIPPPGSGHDLVLLSLKSPGSARVQGTIRGIAPTLNGGTLVTVTNNWLEMVSLSVSEETELTMRGRAVPVDELELGQRVLAGDYDPISAKAGRLVLGPPRTLRIMGEITTIDQSQSSITITPRRGETVSLSLLGSVPNRINLRGTADPKFSDLRQGQQVRIGFYDPVTMEALKLVVD